MPNPFPSDRPADPDYDELWVLAHKLSAVADAAAAAGFQAPETLGFSGREVEILETVDRDMAPAL